MPAAFLSAALLRDPAQRSVRIIARARLQRVLEEAARVEVRAGAVPSALPPVGPGPDSADPEAIHDFRVALRRLRAWLRAFRPCLEDTVERDSERRMRSLSRLAGRARDLEVQYAWLTGLRRAGPARDAARRLAAGIGRQLVRARRALAKEVVAELPAAAAELAGELEHYRQDVALEQPAEERMAAAMAWAVQREAGTLAAELQRVRRPGQVAAAHAARIAVKRLRYLLEGFGRSSRSATGILAGLTAMQHLFGELHDAQVLRRRAAGSPPVLRALLARRVSAAFRSVERTIRAPATREMFSRIEALVRRLERTAPDRAPSPRSPRPASTSRRTLPTRPSPTGASSGAP
ncbi:MAG TPA: CHAD domain-containing protein [Gemmatimonadales bacterium]